MSPRPTFVASTAVVMDGTLTINEKYETCEARTLPTVGVVDSE